MMSQSTLGIGLTMFLRDQFTGPAAKIRAAAGSMSTDMRKLQEDQLRYTRNVNAGGAFMGAMVLRRMGQGIKMAAEYGYEMEYVKSVTGATGAEQKKLAAIAERLAGETMFFPKDIAEGMRYMAMAGMQAPEVMGNIEGAVALAGSTMSQLGGKGGAADIMTNVMKQFNLDFKDTNKVADILSYAVTKSNTNLFDLGEALKYAGSTSMDLNVSLQESAAMVMALGNAGMQGSMAGVAMENSMRYLTKAFGEFGSGNSKKALAEMGLSLADVTDQQGNLISMTQIMKKMGNALSGMDTVRRQDMLTAIFGVRGKRAASLFIRNLQEFEKFTGQISTESSGYAGGVMQDMMSTLWGEHDKLVSELQSTWIAFTEAIEPFLKIMLKSLTAVAKVLTTIFKTPWLGNFLGPAIAAFITIKTVSMAYNAVVAGLRLMHMQLGGSAITMAGQTVAGYQSMTAAAAAYALTVKQGTFAAGTSNYAMLAHAAKNNKMRGLTTNAAGRIISKKTGQWVSGAGAAAVMAGTSRVAGGKVIASTMTRTLLGKVVGFMGGPLGIALSFILPGLIGLLIRAIRGNKDELNENTEAILSKNQVGSADGMKYIHAVDFLQDYKPRIMAMQALGQNNITQGELNNNKFLEEFFGKPVSNFPMQPDKNASGDIIINLDGDKIFKAKVIDIVNRQFQKAGM